MHRVRRAIILAAGVGRRMQPITRSTPKPLVKVNGVRMIDTIIQALRINGITEIYIVVGHLKEQFWYLAGEYPGVFFIENPYYDTCNNIASLYVARDFIEEAMILDGDQLIYNAAVLAPQFQRSGYNAVWSEGVTKEWLLTVERGVVTHCSRTGGRGGWRLCSISRWNARDGKKLKRHIEIEFAEKGNDQIYWDDVALFCYPGEYQLGIWEMRTEDVAEIDSLDELAALDKSYTTLPGGTGEKEKI